LPSARIIILLGGSRNTIFSSFQLLPALIGYSNTASVVTLEFYDDLAGSFPGR
jgi:hypothetical protein